MRVFFHPILRLNYFDPPFSFNAAGYNPLVVGDVGSLQSILEDYLEFDRYQVRGVC